MAKISSPEKLNLMQSVHDLLLHKSTLLEGLVLRVAGMESLIQNLINLVRNSLRLLDLMIHELMLVKAFTVVNQKDSNALKEDSQAMKTIATMTMLFLPATTIAVGPMTPFSKTAKAN